MYDIPLILNTPTTSRDDTPRERRYYVWTVGCQMNISDSERLESGLQSVGYAPAARPEEASFVVLNSCSVRASAEERIIGKIGDLHRVKREYPALKIVLWGCMVGPENRSIFEEKLPIVDHFVSPSAVDEVVALAPNAIYTLDEPTLPIADWNNPPVVVHVPIQYGCNMACSYCVIPLRRGREVSRPLAEIVDEVTRIVARGAKEITLLGQIVDSWGHDLPGRPGLADLLRAVHEVPGLVRLRFLTSHPAWMSDSLIEAMAELPKIPREINLPIQHGSDAMLKRMKRGYTVARYKELAAKLRRAMPDIALSTDIIVGHPGETEAEFDETVQMVNDIRFDKIHIAAYSARPGTIAAELEDDPSLAIPEHIKAQRRHILDTHQAEIASERSARLHDTIVEVLVEAESKGKWRGRSGGNQLVFFASPEDWRGRVARVHVTHTSPWSMSGDVIGEAHATS